MTTAGARPTRHERDNSDEENAMTAGQSALTLAAAVLAAAGAGELTRCRAP